MGTDGRKSEAEARGSGRSRHCSPALLGLGMEEGLPRTRPGPTDPVKRWIGPSQGRKPGGQEAESGSRRPRFDMPTGLQVERTSQADGAPCHSWGRGWGAAGGGDRRTELETDSGM